MIDRDDLFEKSRAEIRREYYREWSANNKEKIRGYGRNYHKKHKKKYLAYQKKWKQEINPKKAKGIRKRTYEKNKDAEHKRASEWRKKNPERTKEIVRKSWSRHKDKYNKQKRLRRLKNGINK